MAKVIPIPTRPDPTVMPEGLEAAGQALWVEVQKQYLIEDIGGYETLRQICCAADMIVRLRKRIDADGEMTDAKGVLREHPAVKMELQYRSFVVRGLQRLGLNSEPIRPTGRPPGPGFA